MGAMSILIACVNVSKFHYKSYCTRFIVNPPLERREGGVGVVGSEGYADPAPVLLSLTYIPAGRRLMTARHRHVARAHSCQKLEVKQQQCTYSPRI
jgi:hypothetical protein